MKSGSVAITLVALAMAGCGSSMKVETDFDRAATFTDLETYDWAPPELAGQQGAANPQSERRIIAAVERELGERGYRKDSDAPDFLVGFVVVREEKIDQQTVLADSVLGYVSAETRMRTYEEGMLVLFVARADDQKVIWQGAATETFQSPSREEVDKAIDEAVKKILSGFPPGS
ncbi:MAG: hypothetical protein AMS21_13715 [Gemmatimonas sp. SG8_38_2]|nr:MAG: hypothetical protein AMS21_13715 [Gemmatimonas sp. SG8_38_2]